MLEGVDEVPWHRLGQGHGDASEVPNLMRQIAAGLGPDPEDRPVWGVWSMCFASDRVCELAAHCVPYLLELSTIPAIPDRPVILGLLTEIARGESAENIFRDPAEGPEPDYVEVSRAAMSARLDLVLPLLEDADPQVGKAAAFLLSCLPEAAGRSLSPLKLRAAAGGDLVPAVFSALAVGRLAAKEQQEWLSQQFRTAPHQDLRAAAAAGLALAGQVENANVVRAAADSITTPGSAFEVGEWDFNGDGIRLLGSAFHRAEPWHRALARDLATRRNLGPDQEFNALLEVREAIWRWRTVAQELVPTLMEVADVAPARRDLALGIIAGAGQVGQADYLAALLDNASPDEQRSETISLAVKGLAHLGDARGVPWLTAALLQRQIRHVSFHTTIPAMATHAAAMLPAVETYLRDRDLQNGPHFDHLDIMQGLASWGEAAAPLVPAIKALLPEQAIVVVPLLGAIGPGALDAVPQVAALLEGERYRTEAAWALWRITGELGDTAAILTEDLAGSGHQASDVAPLLEDLGPAASIAVPHLRALLADEEYGDRWDLVAVSRALWAITGDPEGLITPLVAAITARPMESDGRWRAQGLHAVEGLALMGAEAAQAVPALEVVATGTARVTQQDAFMDERYQRAAEQALVAIRSS